MFNHALDRSVKTGRTPLPHIDVIWFDTTRASKTLTAEIEAALRDLDSAFDPDNLSNLIVRPSTRFEAEKRHIYLDRLVSKNRPGTWPGLTILLACRSRRAIVSGGGAR